jgi:DNA-3-methyladenine glycosylase I
MIEYHDVEWGVPSHDDRHLFEHIVLEGAQAGLNWELVLKKRAGYRRAFAGYDLAEVAAFGEGKVEELALDPGIVRNRLKIRSVIANARAALKVQEQFGSLGAYLWGMVDGKPKQNSWRRLSEIPAVTPESTRVSKEMARRGFRFVGPTGIYAFMQACGMVNDHVVQCFRYAEVRAMSGD